MMDTVAGAYEREETRRREVRFIVSEELARLVMRTAGAHLPLSRLDTPFQWSTTVYCDTYDWSVYRAAEQGNALRLRFREYHRTRPERAFDGPRVFIELKEEDLLTSRKERFEVGVRHVPAFLRGEPVLPAGGNGLGESARRLVAAGARPVIVTQYNRLAYAAAEDVIRVTADHNLIYLAIAWASNADGVIPAPIGPLLARAAGVVIEVKWFDDLPAWGEELLGYLRTEAPDEQPSKFVVGMRYLLGRAGGA